MTHTCIIVEDEPMAASLLEGYIQSSQELVLKGIFHTPIEALNFLKENPIELIFLDINLPLLNGMQVAKLLPQNQMIVFTTAYSQYAVEGYEHNAIDYLMKPISFERFMTTLKKIRGIVSQRETSTDPASIYVKSGKSFIQINFDDIFYIEGLKDYVMIHTTKTKIVAYKRMKELEDILPAQFSRIHLSHIINRKKITKVEDNHVFLMDTRFSISETYRQSFFELINKTTL
jgi:DNA-binding LytR/AlgR family response regulator